MPSRNDARRSLRAWLLLFAALAVLCLFFLFLYPWSPAQTAGSSTSEVPTPASTGQDPTLDDTLNGSIRHAIDTQSHDLASPTNPQRVTRTIRIVDSDLRPLLHATIEILSPLPSRAILSDGGGLVELGMEWPRLAQIHALVTADQCCHKNVVIEPDQDAYIVLSPRQVIHGRVLDSVTRLPVPDALVSLPHLNCVDCKPDIHSTSGLGLFSTSSFSSSNLLRVVIQANGYVPFVQDISLRDTLQTAPLDLVLDPGVAASGVVLDYSTGEPVRGASIRLGAIEGAMSDGQGLFSIKVPAGAIAALVSISLQAPGYCTVRRSVRPCDLIAVLSSIRLPRAARLECKVVDPEGRSLGEAQLRVQVPDVTHLETTAPFPPTDWVEYSRLWEVSGTVRDVYVQANDQGLFEVGGLPPFARDVDVYCDGAGRGRLHSHVGPILGPGESLYTLLRLEPHDTGRITGRLLLNGSPAGGHIDWKCKTDSGSIAVAESGDFDIDEVEAGEVVLHAYRGRSSTFAADFASEHSISLARGATHALDLDLRVSLLDISGIVVTPDGAPIPGIPVEARERTTGPHPFGSIRALAMTNRDGTFSFSLPTCGSSFDLSVSAGPHKVKTDGIMPGTSDVRLVVGPQHRRILYRVFDSHTQALISTYEIYGRRHSTDRFAPLAGSFFAPSPDADGWQLLQVTDGTWDFHARASAAGYEPRTLSAVSIAVQGETRISFAMTAGATLRITPDPAQQPWPETNIAYLVEDHALAVLGMSMHDLSAIGDTQSLLTLVNADRIVAFPDGRSAEIRGLAAGRYQFFVRAQDAALEPSAIEITSKFQELTLRRK